MISFIIPTLPRNRKYLDFCVKSILENTSHNFEILIVSNGEGSEYPQGQWEAVNRGIKDSRGDWIFVINDDMYLPKGWDRNLAFPSECFSPNTNWTHEPIAELEYVELNAGRDLEEFDKKMVDNFMRGHEDNRIDNGFHFPIIFSKKLWEKVGGFDENYDPWGSNGDSDFEYKVFIAGVQPKIHRGIFVYHFGNKSETFVPERQEYWQKNWDYFINKWGFSREETPDIQKANLHIPLDKIKYKPIWSKYR